MENASKALLIAGAILIVILLIAVGMMVYRGAQGSINKAIGQMSSTEKDIHNSQFEPYLGTNKSGSELRTLYSKVITNNSEDDNIDVVISNITVAPSGTTTAMTASTVTATSTTPLTSAQESASMSNIKTGASARYNVEAFYNDGVITGINVTIAHQ